MPTDPFVSPDLDDRPRQQQNLPPGVAYPPSRRWQATRPGELAPGRPHGPLVGSPGPNVGYAYTLAHRAAGRFRMAAHEHVDDAVAVVAETAGKRAVLFGRGPVIGDVESAMALLGYDGSTDDEFAEWRARAVHGAAHSYTRRRAMVDAVPDEVLRGRPAEVVASAGAWREGVRSSIGTVASG